MISALSLKGIAYLFISPFVATFGLLLLVKCFTQPDWGSIMFWGQHLFHSFTFTVFALLILGTPAGINAVWGQFPVLNKEIAPNINGEYNFATNSNYPLKKAMRDCLNGEKGSFEECIPEQLNAAGKITIRMSLLRIVMTYEPATAVQSRSSSHVIGASLQKLDNQDGFELSYVFIAHVPDPSPETDSQHYYGAARLFIQNVDAAPERMTGNYWTNRQWQVGLNTAGNCEATRTE